MAWLRRFALIVVLASSGLHGQSAAELADFIIQEFRASESDVLEIKEVKFTDGESVFKLTTSSRGYLTEQALEFSLADADVFTRRTLVQSGNEFVSTYALVAAPRGRAGGIRQNMSRVRGQVVLLDSTPNGTRILNLERAFARLAERVTGRRRPAPVRQDGP